MSPSAVRAAALVVVVTPLTACNDLEPHPHPDASIYASPDTTADATADPASHDAEPDATAAPSWPCQPADVAPPHAAGTSYLGVHANPQNNDLVACEAAGAWTSDWHALQGRAMAQPNTFSPDGATTYATTSAGEDGCTVHAIDVPSGDVLWCFAEPQALGSSVAVDAEGNLYVTGSAGVVSLTAAGVERWRRPFVMPDDAPGGPTGLHLHPLGYVAAAGGNGEIALLDRATGETAAALSVFDGFDLPRIERPGLSVDLEPLLPQAVVDDFVDTFGSVDQLLAIFAGVGDQWTDNTIGIAPNGTLYALGSGATADTGALVQVRVDASGDGVALAAGWVAEFQGGSASSPSISPDGHWLKITDGNSTAGLLTPDAVEARALLFDIDACDDNTDDDDAPDRCAPALTVPLLSGPALGASPMLDDLEHYVWEVQFADLFGSAVPDLIRYEGTAEIWRLDLPDDAVWSSVLTITDRHIVGTRTTFTDSGQNLLTISLPATASSALVAVDRATGEVVFTAPTTDDSTSTVTIGPDGALYVTQLGLLSGFAIDTRITGGIMRFAPTAAGSD